MGVSSSIDEKPGLRRGGRITVVEEQEVYGAVGEEGFRSW